MRSFAIKNYVMQNFVLMLCGIKKLNCMDGTNTVSIKNDLLPICRKSS